MAIFLNLIRMTSHIFGEIEQLSKSIGWRVIVVQISPRNVARTELLFVCKNWYTAEISEGQNDLKTVTSAKQKIYGKG